MPTAPTLVELDTRGRVSLGKVADHHHYLLRHEEGGVLILEPAVVVSTAQARLDAQPELKAQLTDALARPARAVPRRQR